MQIGNRIIFDQDGEIMYQSGEMQGDVLPRKEVTSLDYVDLDYGAVNFQTHRIVRIDVDTKQPVLESLEIVLSPEQQRIKELEDQLLILADAETGGIL
ncbi:hypothetical protein E6C60_2021 [Paenibacillus algicola]|uniref:Uncharacterized protein n=1 Tax=Paenibacillus algicola TaxID=2565926 RepID=A0A4P8XJD6_9BACL|nr:hypothetical protein [Paenibacillus algicola]QCT02736.1 hypothetical protein E6C60_2021 [Paenibacillus algicola]